MARVNVPVTASSRAGATVPTPVNGDAVNGHTVQNDGRVIVLVENTGASSRNVTVQVKGTIDGQEVTETPRAVAAGASKLFGPYNTSDYGLALDIDVTHAECKLLAFRLGTS